jgi:hypothetical protein
MRGTYRKRRGGRKQNESPIAMRTPTSFGYIAPEDDGGTINDFSSAEGLNRIINQGNAVDAH